MTESPTGPLERDQRPSLLDGPRTRFVLILREPWSRYLLCGGMAITIYFMLVPFGLASDHLYNLIGLSAAIAIVVGVHIHKPQRAGPWYLLAAGQVLFVAGDVMFTIYAEVLHDDSFPSPADGLYLSAYPVLAAGLFLFMRSRRSGRDLSSPIDAAIIATGFGLLSWTYLMAPYANDPAFGLAEKLVSIAYPLADIVLLAVAARLIISGGARTVSFAMLCVSLILLLAADSAFAVLVLGDNYTSGSVVDVLWLGSYVFWGASALHPSMGRMTEEGQGKASAPSTQRLALLALVSLVSPVVSFTQLVRGAPIDVVNPLASGLMFLLVVTRVTDLVAQGQAKVGQLHRQGADLARSLQGLKAAQGALELSEERFRSLVQNASDIMGIVADDGSITYVSPSVTAVLGRTPEELIGTNVFDYVHPEDADRVLSDLTSTEDSGDHSSECRVLRPDGSIRFLEVVTSGRVNTAEGAGVVINCSDITERRSFEDQLRRQAFHEPLTGLPNRALFMDRLEHALRSSPRTEASLAVLFIDLDRFKLVNDSLGHTIGDELLVSVARRLERCLRGGDTASRWGGDEFAILLEGVTGIDDALRVADRIMRELKTPFTLDGRETYVTCSIGIALQNAKHLQPDHLLRDADVALYRAKADGRACYVVFDNEMNVRAVERLELESELVRVVERGELEVFYQPEFDLGDGRIVGFEALARWRHPVRGYILPDEFIATAEENRLIVNMGREILTRACRQLHAWHETHPAQPPLTMSVNVSPRQLQRSEFVAEARAILADTGVNGNQLRLEITEGVLLFEDQRITQSLGELRRLGISIAIDDFGTGYSSLTYLTQFQADILKIDRSFVHDLDTDVGKQAIVKALVTLAKNLGMRVVAEGIETHAQARTLLALRCYRGQGFYLARPSDSASIRRSSTITEAG